MRKAKEILEAINEAQYKIYNTQEEAEEGLSPETRQTYDEKDIRNIFIGTIYGETNSNTIDFLRSAINKMPDEWVLEFLKVINGDTVEKISESVTKSKDLIPTQFKEENTDSWTKEKVKTIIGFLINVPEFEEKYGMKVNKTDTGYVLKSRSGKQFTITIENGERDI